MNKKRLMGQVISFHLSSSEYFDDNYLGSVNKPLGKNKTKAIKNDVLENRLKYLQNTPHTQASTLEK